MDIKHVEMNGRGAFRAVGEDGKSSAELTYVSSGSAGFIIDHTEVDEGLRGQGVGEKLVEAAVDHARSNNLKIHATCPFAIKVLRENAEYRDVYSG